MTRKTPDWLRRRRDFCEERFSFLIGEFGYHRSVRRFRSGGFQLGYLGPGACVLVEWYQRDGVMVWLLPVNPGEVPASWGGPGRLRGFDLGLVAAAAGSRPEVSDAHMHGLADEVMTALAGQLRLTGQGLLRGDYSQVPAIKDLIRASRAPAQGPAEPVIGAPGLNMDRAGDLSAAPIASSEPACADTAALARPSRRPSDLRPDCRRR